MAQISNTLEADLHKITKQSIQNPNKSYQSIMYIQTLYKPANKITLV